MNVLSLLVMLLATSCLFANQAEQETFCACQKQATIYNLDESTQIVLALIQGDSLSMLLEHSDQDNIEAVLKNLSPAEIAFEAEVLNCQDPVFVLFATESCPDYAALKEMLEDEATLFQEKAKFVEIDVDKLFKLAQVMSVTEIPLLMFIRERVEQDHVLGFIEDQAKLHEWIESCINQPFAA